MIVCCWTVYMIDSQIVLGLGYSGIEYIKADKFSGHHKLVCSSLNRLFT